MERIKRNPAGWGLLFGGVLAVIAGLFSWVTVTNTELGTTTRATALDSMGPQTLFLCACVILLAGIGVLGSKGRTGRIVWALLGLLAAVVVLAAGLIGIFVPETLAARFIKAESFSKALTATDVATGDQIQAAFDAGTLTAKLGLGAIVGAVGGALGVLGAVWSFRRPTQRGDG